MNAAWDRAFPECIHDAAGRRTTQRMRFGLSALTTPPWAQDIGCEIDTVQLLRVMEEAPAHLVVLDLPAGRAAPDLPSGMWALERHTRQCPLTASDDPTDGWPANRRKQLRRAEREGMTASSTEDLELLVSLHQNARKRKGLHSDGVALHTLLRSLLNEPDTHAWIVRNAAGQPISGGVFHGAGDGRCIYGFGGQFRSAQPGESSRATVLLIATAMRHAAEQGKDTFDFGGSQDPGVDRFYAEFGADAVPKWRLVRIRGPWKWVLRWRRPDLFPR